MAGDTRVNDLAEFMGRLLSMGMKREQVLERGYDFALAELMSQQGKNDTVTPGMMSLAAAKLQGALPEAYRIYDIHNRIR